MKKGKEGSHLRQGNGRESVDQPAAQLVRLSWCRDKLAGQGPICRHAHTP